MNGRRWMTAAATVTVFAALVLLAACTKQGGTTSVKTQLETAQQIAKMEQDINTRQQAVNTLLQQYVSQGGQDLGPLMGQGLTPEQTALLEQRLKGEQGIGYRDLVSDILAKQKSVEEAKVRIQDLEKTLPSPVDVQRGERHSEIALNYLTKDKGLDQATAKKLVGQVNLVDELVPGFKVWNFYNDGVYGTFVTQGTAKVSPYGMMQHAKQVLVAEKNTAIAQRDTLSAERDALNKQVAELNAKRDELNLQVTDLQTQREGLTKKVADLEEHAADLESRNNSVFYRIGYRKGMISDGLVRDPWYGQPMLAKFDESDFPQHIDLRSADAIAFTATQAGVPKITKVKVAPGSVFKTGVDYAVAITDNGATATVRIINKDKFRAGRSVMILVN